MQTRYIYIQIYNRMSFWTEWGIYAAVWKIPRRSLPWAYRRTRDDRYYIAWGKLRSEFKRLSHSGCLHWDRSYGECVQNRYFYLSYKNWPEGLCLRLWMIWYIWIHTVISIHTSTFTLHDIYSSLLAMHSIRLITVRMVITIHILTRLCIGVKRVKINKLIQRMFEFKN